MAWEAGKPLSVEEIQVAAPKDHEVRIEIYYTGVCHTGTVCGYTQYVEDKPLMQNRRLHPLWQRPRGCLPHRPWPRGSWYRRIRRCWRHISQARRPRRSPLVTNPPILQVPPNTLTFLPTSQHPRMQRMQVLQVRQDESLRQDPSHPG